MIKFEFNKSYLILDTPKDNGLCYQLEIINFKGSEKDFENLWKQFLNKRSCHSCICKLNLSFLENFGFKKIDDFYSYYPFSAVYRIDDQTDGKFYVGMCEIKNKWNDGYTGSGRRWKNHYNAHPDHEYKRTILKQNFKTPLDTRNFEYSEIEKVFEDKNNCNSQLRTQSQNYSVTKCEECGVIGGMHLKTCSQYKDVICTECGAKRGRHKKRCSKAKICLECKTALGYHKKSCSQYKPLKECPECKGKHGHHKKGCSQYKDHKQCPECESRGAHKSWCSKYKEFSICPKCGGKGNHKKNCPLRKQGQIICSECQGKEGKHFKFCSRYKKPIPCSECGKINGHKAFCSKAKVCSECGGKCGNHKKTCSKYKSPATCSECGGFYGKHFKSCSKYKSDK